MLIHLLSYVPYAQAEGHSQHTVKYVGLIFLHTSRVIKMKFQFVWCGDGAVQVEYADTTLKSDLKN